KRGLQKFGYYKVPSFGFTEIPDQAMMDGIKKFQQDNNLYAEGVMRPGDKTEAALNAKLSTANSTAGGKNDIEIDIHDRTRVKERWKREYSKKYIWHAQSDNKTRSAHAARDGKEFYWNNPPEGGHPGQDHNCRCWAEPIFDDMARGKKCEELACNIEFFRTEKWKAINDVNELNAWIKKVSAFAEVSSYENVTSGLSKIGRSVPENTAAGCGTGSAKGGRVAGLPGAMAGCAAGALSSVAQGIILDGIKAIKNAHDVSKTASEQIEICKRGIAYFERKINQYDEDIDKLIKAREELSCKWNDKCPSQ
ncbi:MAG: hypothetical protein GY804_06975, partial [Alphaproteobacteria bacterium]|nr:hypothetical protein [Alphaproteobacteria bacterium]